MAALNTVTGLDTVLSNLNKEIQGIKGRSRGGLMLAGLFIQGESQKLAPVEFGFLKASAYTRFTPEDENVVEIGYTASYAVYVHEILENYHPVGQAKYLESPLKSNHKEILKLIRSQAKVKT